MTHTSEQKNPGETLNQSIKDIEGKLALAIAHEIRNTLTTIKGAVKLLQKGKEKERYCQMAESEIERAVDFLNDLLALSNQQPALQQLNVCCIAEEVILLLAEEAISKGIKIIKEFEPVVPAIYGNKNQLKQVFINFIKNGMDAMEEGGTFKIEVMGKKQELLVRFTDTGCGIPKEIISKIGQPFFTTKEKGTGLGFMISKNIIEKHHGQLFISSEENKGATIEIRFPIQEQEVWR